MRNSSGAWARRAARCSLVAMLATPGIAQSSSDTPSRNGIFIVGSLHRLHDSVSAFDFGALRHLIARIEPQVVLLEVRQTELDARGDTPGRPEYPRVVWPMLERGAIAAFAMEPDGVLYDSLTGAAKLAIDHLTRTDSATAAFWRRLHPTFARVLGAYWRSPAAVHDSVSADMSRGLSLLQDAMLGAGFQHAQERWDAIMIDRAAAVARANPDKRVLILASYRNRHRLVEAMRLREPARVVAMDEWIAEIGHPAGRPKR